MNKEDENFLNKKRLNNFPLQFPKIIKENPKKEAAHTEALENLKYVKNPEEIIDKLNEEFNFSESGKGRLDECEINIKNDIFMGNTVNKEKTTILNNNSNANNKHPRHLHHFIKNPHFPKKELPIIKYHDDILNKLRTNQVIVIAGETGCGKTTQVPQFIYNDFTKKKKNVIILITQPRRIAAVSIAKRLSVEMKFALGGIVGYHVGMRPEFNANETKILIVTTGIFLQRIIHEKNLDEFTHIILDEVHERDIDIDFVLVLIKHILKTNSKIKLILMSATISTHLFANYFSVSSVSSIESWDFYKDKNIKKIENEEQDKNDLWQKEVNNFNNNNKPSDSDNTFKEWTYAEYPKYMNTNNQEKKEGNNNDDMLSLNEDNMNKETLKKDAAPIIHIAEKIYPVHLFYVDQFLKRLEREQNKDFSSFNINFDKRLPKIDNFLNEICFYLIRNIHQNKIFNENNIKYSILVFLPGFGEIATMHEMMLKNLDDKELDEMEILRLHSNLAE